MVAQLQDFRSGTYRNSGAGKESRTPDLNLGKATRSTLYVAQKHTTRLKYKRFCRVLLRVKALNRRLRNRPWDRLGSGPRRLENRSRFRVLARSRATTKRILIYRLILGARRSVQPRRRRPCSAIACPENRGQSANRPANRRGARGPLGLRRAALMLWPSGASGPPCRYAVREWPQRRLSRS